MNDRPPATRDRTAIIAPAAPAAIGPYSHAVQSGGLLFCSGALPIDPDDEQIVDGGVGLETTQCLENLQSVCGAAGTELSKAARLTVYTTKLGSFAEINEAYSAFFGAEPPARVAIGVAALPKNANVEIDAIVAIT